MKRFAKYLYIAAAALAALASGCSTSPSASIEGEYELNSQSVQINGVIVNLADWPGSSVSVTSMDGDRVLVSIDSLLPGFDTLSIDAKAVKEGKDKYSFSSYDPYYLKDREIQISGTVDKGELSLSVTDIYQSEITGRWKPAFDSDGLADMNIVFSSPLLTEIDINGQTISMDVAVTLINVLAKSALTGYLGDLRRIELDNTGYVNISWDGDISPELEPALTGVVQYWSEPEDSCFHLYLRRTICDGLGLPVSPLDLTLRYFTEENGDTIGIGLDRTTALPLLLSLSESLNTLTYADYTAAGAPLGDIGEESFDRLKATVALLPAAMAMPSTEFRIEFHLSRETI